MLTQPSWIDYGGPGRLAVSPRPRGGDWLEDEMKAWRMLGIDVVVSLLTPEESSELALENEAECCRTAELEFRNFPIEDRSVPTSRDAFSALASELAAVLIEGKTVIIHCRQGIGRSGLLAILVLNQAGSTNSTSDYQGFECPWPQRSRNR